MGCCQARASKMQENFFTIGLCYIQQSERQFDECPLDKIVYRYFQRYCQHGKEQQLDVQSVYMLEGEEPYKEMSEKEAVVAYTKVLNQIINSLQTYSDKLKVEMEEASKGENKFVLVGQKYTS